MELSMWIQRHSKTKWRILLPRESSENLDTHVIPWCREHFGDPGRTRSPATWRVGHTSLHYTITFKNEMDAMFFMMRWGK
jgi:hypothetical protein